MKNLLVAGILVCVFYMSACSPRDFLTRRLARDLIASSRIFNTPQQFWMRTGILSSRDYPSPEYLVLQRHGWLTAGSVACPPEITSPPCWDVLLTPIGFDTFRDLVSKGTGASSYFSVQTARRELVVVTGISKDGTQAEIDFLWKWVPLNEVGAALYAGNVQYRSTVGFKHYDDGWRMLENPTAKSYQDLEDALKGAEPER
jgi:hypothetical protein